MNLKLSINFIFYVIFLSFLIGTEKVIYFSVFSPKHANCPLNSSAHSASSLILK